MSNLNSFQKEKIEHAMKMLQQAGVTPDDILQYQSNVVYRSKQKVKIEAEKLKYSPQRYKKSESVVKANMKSRLSAKKTQAKVAQNLAYQAKIYDEVVSGKKTSSRP